jgi:uncharacterized iron-regulated membrane protein
MAVFLVVAGLTGGLLAFYPELDRALNPELLRVSPPSPGAVLLDPLELNARVKAQLPKELSFHNLTFKREPDESRAFWIEIAPEEWRETFVDPYLVALLQQLIPGEGVAGIQGIRVLGRYRPLEIQSQAVAALVERAGPGGQLKTHRSLPGYDE